MRDRAAGRRDSPAERDVVGLHHLGVVAVALHQADIDVEGVRREDRLRADEGLAAGIEHRAVGAGDGFQVGPARRRPGDIRRHGLLFLVVEGQLEIPARDLETEKGPVAARDGQAGNDGLGLLLNHRLGRRDRLGVRRLDRGGSGIDGLGRGLALRLDLGDGQKEDGKDGDSLHAAIILRPPPGASPRWVAGRV